MRKGRKFKKALAEGILLAKGMEIPPKEVPYKREQPKIGANEKCPCNSGKKYKYCCG